MKLKTERDLSYMEGRMDEQTNGRDFNTSLVEVTRCTMSSKVNLENLAVIVSSLVQKEQFSHDFLGG